MTPETKEPKYVTVNEISDLDDTIDSMMKFINGVWVCTVCEKQKRKKSQLKCHIEVHIDGITHPCKVCGRIYRSRNSLQNHTYNSHKTICLKKS